ncbi:hypothetical protein L484_003543 [Morus notabilis]|uniref:SHSP domain-containing protein n=1 Tax=Morus notabilis TaxID=981085 RepID=W9RK90_9ROSA|nr:inactive protein RESTRICTED TEV MOVEMENT 2 [Morus notabilis]EXB95064.1 hypothetical protein L484_003543 [Morus notabilis]
MEMQDDPNSPPSYSYMDFEPYCAWHREEGVDILAVHLHGFKREQMRVQVNSQRILTIHGQRPLDETKWSRFSKQNKLPNECMEDGIRAKFAAGILTITMPKRCSSSTARPHQHHQETSTRDQPKAQVHEEDANMIKRNDNINDKMKSISGMLGIAGKFASLVLLLAVSGAYVNCISKLRSCAAQN